MATTAPTSGDPNGDNALDIQSHTACHNTLDTSELLEHILLHLPMRDLLLDQRVCKTWKACIDNSVKLQRGLFFKPAGKIMVLPCPPEDVLPHMAVQWSESDNFFANPLLVDVFGSFDLANYILFLETSTTHLDSFTRPEASWRRMLVTQPPQPNIDLARQTLKAQKELVEDADPVLMALREALNSRTTANPLQRSNAVLQGIDDLEEQLLSTLPQQSQQPVRQALDMLMDQKKPRNQVRQAFRQLVIGVPAPQALNMMTSLGQFALRWLTIHDACLPLVVANAIFQSPPYECAKQLEGL